MYYNVICILNNIKNTTDNINKANISMIGSDILVRLTYGFGFIKYNKKKQSFRINPALKNKMIDIPTQLVSKQDVNTLIPVIRKNVIDTITETNNPICGNECLAISETDIQNFYNLLWISK